MGEWLFVFPLCGFSLSLCCNYYCSTERAEDTPGMCAAVPRYCCHRTPLLGRQRQAVALLPHMTDLDSSALKNGWVLLYRHYCHTHAGAASQRDLEGVCIYMGPRTAFYHFFLQVCHSVMSVHLWAAVPSFCRSTRPRKEDTSRWEPPLCSISAVLRDASVGAEHPSSTASRTVRVHISERLEWMVAVSHGCPGEGQVLGSLVKPAQHHACVPQLLPTGDVVYLCGWPHHFDLSSVNIKEDGWFHHRRCCS